MRRSTFRRLKKRKKRPRSAGWAVVRPKKSVSCGQKAVSKKSATFLVVAVPVLVVVVVVLV